MAKTDRPGEKPLSRPGTAEARLLTVAEIALVFAVFFLHGAWSTPDSNETYYLTKARHYWRPDWCKGDFFLESKDAHQVFYWTFGWLAALPADGKATEGLAAVAWVGRVLTWLLLAIAWQRLSAAVVPRPWFSVLTAGVFVGLSERAHMAGEWVIGGVEAKGFAFALVFFALERLVRERWKTAWVLLGFAAAFHILVGGWAMVATAVAWIAAGKRRPPVTEILPAVLIAVLLASPSVLFGLGLTAGVDPTTVDLANRIQVFERLDHHLRADDFATGFIVRHLLVAVLWLALLTLKPMARPVDRPAATSDRGATDDGVRLLWWFVAASIGIALVGFALTWVLREYKEHLAAVMKYYWFRASDAFVPLGAALALGGFIVSLLALRPALGRLWLAGTVLCIGLDSADQIQHLPFNVPLREAPPTRRGDKNVEYEDWVDVCKTAMKYSDPGDVFITPRMSATFRWYAERPQVAIWKDMPQDAGSIVEWWQRMSDLHAIKSDEPITRWYESVTELEGMRLYEAASKYGAKYVIVELDKDLPQLRATPIYQNQSYAVYVVDR
jgi:uncharacterized protein DUF6798